MNSADWIKQIAALLGSAVILAFVVNAVSPRAIPWQGQWDESQGVVTTDQDSLQPTLDFEIPDAPTARRLQAAGTAPGVGG